MEILSYTGNQCCNSVPVFYGVALKRFTFDTTYHEKSAGRKVFGFYEVSLFSLET